MIMASETYDYESFDNTDHTMKQIADAIRHKGYGKDVREAIAQGMESYDRTSGELFKCMNKVEEKTDQEIEDRKKGDDELNQRIKVLENKLNRVIAEMIKLNNNQDKLQEEVDELYNFGRHDRQVILEHINLEKLR